MLTKNIYYKKVTTFQTKKVSEKNGTVLHFCKSLTSGLTGDSWILISASVFNLLQYLKKLLHTHERMSE